MNEKNEPARPTIANELLEQLASLVVRAQTLAQCTAEQLEPIMKQATPRMETDCNTPEEQYPPLFSEYRDKLHEIENALYNIEECLGRTEV